MEIPEIPSLHIIIGVVGLVIIIHLAFTVSINIKAKALKRLQNRWNEIAPANEEADRIIKELTTMRRRIDAIDALIQKRISWAKKLSDLNDAIIPGVWLNRLWIERKVIYHNATAEGAEAPAETSGSDKTIIKTLHLNGQVIASGGEETAAVGKFMWSLEHNDGFFAHFSEIETVYMQQSKVEDTEVMDFELVCYFK